ncbi:MAG: radical SAM protein [Lachnospiraceae bacterium]|nr:radical SAM protein [Lachnospiraceae bacterium]
MKREETSEKKSIRTAGEAGWHISGYNLKLKVPDSHDTIIVNLYKGTCAVYNPIEMFLLSILSELKEDHPIIPRFADRGIIANFDERSALEAMARGGCMFFSDISLTICPTMSCNFDCPYCFEDHREGKMSAGVQDDVVALAERLLDFSGAKSLRISWYGGEPLLAADVIESLSQRLIKLADKKGVSYGASIVTNGYLLTSENIDMLVKSEVSSAQITLDGVGDVHDLTRHLAGGGPTFRRIIDNISNNKIPFKISIRHNVHKDNLNEINGLRGLIERISEESGNDLKYYPSPVRDNDAAARRGKQVNLLCGSDMHDIDILKDSAPFFAGRGVHCVANMGLSMCIDDRGNLLKCWDDVDKADRSFGNVAGWDPEDPIGTATSPDNLTSYLNTSGALDDPECQECIWLPACAGGCPHQRLYYEKSCIPFKDCPEEYVLALYRRMNERTQQQKSV